MVPHRAGLAIAPLPGLVPAVVLPGIRSGWLVVAGAFLVQMAGFGAAYSYAAFAPSLAGEFGVPQSRTSLVFALCGGVAFLLSAVGGRLADRFGSRRPALAGMLLVALGLALAAAATRFAEVVLCYGLLIGCGIGLAYVPSLAAVQRWFDKRRGLASGAAAAGIGVGTALVPPMAQVLLGLGGGWRLAFLVSAALVAACGTAGALLLARSPESRGLAPEPGPHPGPPGPAPGARPAPLIPSPARSARFALIYAGCVLLSVPVGLPLAHLPAFARLETGMAAPEALGLLGLVGLASVAGRFGLGALADRLGRCRTFLGCCWCLAAATGLWAAADCARDLRFFAIAFGLFYGGFVALLPAFVVDLYGRASAGTMLGLLYTSRGVGLLLGPPCIALLAEAEGDATLPILASAALGTAGATLLAFAQRK